jgi:putative glycosyltransferase (TIGR04348 family)
LSRVLIVTPALPGGTAGNAVTAERWAGFLEQLGHEVEARKEYAGEDVDVLVALHARRSAGSIERFARERAGRPLVLALTGTDLYRDLETHASARRSVELATRLVVLQQDAVRCLPEAARAKARVIHQSLAVPAGLDATPKADGFQACVLGHLRPVKDPLLAAQAARDLPEDSKARIVHLGRALSPEMEAAAREEEAVNPRYEWRGEVPRDEALRVLASSHVHVLTSKLEGGANAVGEAIVLGVPTLSTRISGSIGLLGEDYEGYFPVGDADALRALIDKCERNGGFLSSLERSCSSAAPLFLPERELAAWRSLLDELVPAPRTPPHDG